jgi:hypothetical protein
MGAPIKTFLLTGNLLNGDLELQLSPNDNFGSGIWQLNIRQIIYENSTSFSHSVAIASNAVKSHQYCEKTQKFKISSVPLKIFFMKNTYKKLESFDEIWHYINNKENSITLHLVDLETDQKLTIDCKVFILLDLKQTS